VPGDPLSAWLWSQGIDVLTAVEGLAVCMVVALVWGLCLSVVEGLKRRGSRRW
jgi:hypothetical protein